MGLNVARGLGQVERSALSVGARDWAELAAGLRRLRLGGVQHGGGLWVAPGCVPSRSRLGATAGSPGSSGPLLSVWPERWICVDTCW